MSRGIIYSCAGSTRFLQEAFASASSVRKFLPNANICLFHSYEEHQLSTIDTSVFSEIRRISLTDDTINLRFSGHMKWFLAKLYAITQSPYAETLFLDTDTEIKKPISSLFNILKKFDIAIAPGPMTQPPVDNEDLLNELPNEFPELNTGVILYRNNKKIKDFLENWKTTFLYNKNNLYREHGKGGEQVSLRYLLWNSENIRMHILSTQGVPNMFNFRWGSLEKEFIFKNKVVIHHTRYKK